MKILQKWIVELYSNNMDEKQHCWHKSALYIDVDNSATTYDLRASEIYTIRRNLRDFFHASGIGYNGPISILLTNKMVPALQTLLPS